MNDQYPQRTLASWVEFLRDGLLVTDVDEATVAALCGHLADLGVLNKEGAENWQVTPPFADSEIPVKEQMAQRLADLCTTEKGFALRYFLSHPPEFSQADETPEPADQGSQQDKSSRSMDRTTSNLSNLQLVKKYGRQVQSFMELEKNFTDKLQGEHTSLKESRKLFNFILSRMQPKTEPQRWEQLSRRRHK